MKSYYTIEKPIISGIFRGEIKNRFLCTVQINSENIECYIPSSSRLENYVDLDNKEVLLIPNETKNSRTLYSVLALKHNRRNILLNTSIANKAMFHYLGYNGKKLFSKNYIISREKYVGNYKSDLVIEHNSTTTIIEIKSIISTSSNAIFPTVFSDRAIRQLKTFLTEQNCKNIQYCFVSLSPFVQRINLNSEQKEYYTLFKKCIEQGMVFKAYSCYLKGNKVKITGEIPVKL